MIRSGLARVRRGLKRRLKALILPDEVAVTSPAYSAPAAAPPTSPFAAPAETPVEAPAATEPIAASPTDDTAGPPLTLDQVADLIDDMVRPALQSDGGDIDLVKVEDNDVYVRLTGACSTCPSSTVTMKMGIERLLAEEFPQFRHLVQVS